MDQKLYKYIKKELKKGFSLEDIQKALLKAGYPKNIVLDSISEFKQKKSIGIKFPNRLAVTLVIAVLVILIFGYAVYKYFTPSGPEEKIVSAFLPTLENFGEGWRIMDDSAQNILELPEGSVTEPEKNGVVESYFRAFFIQEEKTLSIDYLKLTTMVSRYSRRGLNDIMDAREKVLQDKGVVYNKLPVQYIKENDKTHPLWDDAAEYTELEETNQQRNKCIEFVSGNLFVRVCCIYFLTPWENTCSDNLNRNVEYIAKNIN